MAAAVGSGCEAPVRLRLLFDYPPPVTPACGLCWLLVEPNQVRLVTDLISLIREKFGFSRRAKLNLFLDGALLPPTESARLVRDNDSLRVKLEEVVGENSHDTVTNGFSSLSKKERKRIWQKLEVKDSESEDEEPNKRKKGKWNFEHQEEKSENIQDSVTLGKKKKMAPERTHMMDTKSDDDTSHSKKLRKKMEQEKEQDAKKKKKAGTFSSKSTPQKAKKSLSEKSTKGNIAAQPNTKKGGFSSESSTSSSNSDHSTPGTKQISTLASKGASQHINKPRLASSLKSVSAGKRKDKISLKTGETKKAQNQSFSSDSDSSSEEEEQQSNNLRNRLPYKSQGTETGHSSKTGPKSSSSESDSSESETCALKKPKASATASPSVGGNCDKQLSAISCGLAASSRENRRGRGRGETPFWRGPRVRGCRGMPRGRGRGESIHFFYNYSGEHQKQKQLNEAATNSSVITQNPVEVPKKDYSTLPLLAAPPQVGEKIAFKLLELTENYTPEVSDYKEGKIVSWNPANKQLELEILSFSSVVKEPGKFDLVYQAEDGAETIEYAVSQDRKITESWDALIEPRLIIDPPNNESGAKKGIPSDVNLPGPQM
ncbi:coilin [Candoia aspera]|uniref:coilin n=1 Tax=Candoia aspera TaxID=51853 RepID=UPI002FD7B134